MRSKLISPHGAATASAVMSAQLSAGCDVPKDSQHGSFALLRRCSRVPNRLRKPSRLAAPTPREQGELVVVQDVLNTTTEHRDAAETKTLPGPARKRPTSPCCFLFGGYWIYDERRST